ncbi:hypothetical protein [Streptomyces sp. NPDC016845]|uniref:hypothetical protein n=1 Tax=Streptomyces sp. NPDC016845 TaxID=3364972 RepID=UPI0037B836B6
MSEPPAEPPAEQPYEPYEPYEPAAPVPLGVVRTPTGNADVDAQLERLGDVDHLAADGHVEVYEDVHQGLRTALTALDARPQPSATPSPAPSPAPSPTYEHRS